jgi:hypothetical protein
MKKCCKCNRELPASDFGKLRSSKDGLRYDCNHCRRAYRIKSKEQIADKNHKYYTANKEKVLHANRLYRESHVESIRIQRQSYRNRVDVKEHIKQKNKEHLPKRKEAIKRRRRQDSNFQLAEILRSKIHKMLKNQPTSYIQIVGCGVDWLRSWIEYQFEDGMTWDNLGTYWQIDHILPINGFEMQNPRDRQVCFRWTNLQPLTARANRSKSDKLQLYHYFNSIISIHRFIQYNGMTHQGYQAINESLSWLREKLRDGNKPLDCENGNPQPSLENPKIEEGSTTERPRVLTKESKIQSPLYRKGIAAP